MRLSRDSSHEREDGNRIYTAEKRGAAFATSAKPGKEVTAEAPAPPGLSQRLTAHPVAVLLFQEPLRLLDLQAVVEQCYRNGGYEGTLNYAVAPEPPLRGVDEEWAEERLHELGLRPRKKPPRRKGKPK